MPVVPVFVRQLHRSQNVQCHNEKVLLKKKVGVTRGTSSVGCACDQSTGTGRDVAGRYIYSGGLLSRKCCCKLKVVL